MTVDSKRLAVLVLPVGPGLLWGSPRAALFSQEAAVTSGHVNSVAWITAAPLIKKTSIGWSEKAFFNGF